MWWPFKRASELDHESPDARLLASDIESRAPVVPPEQRDMESALAGERQTIDAACSPSDGDAGPVLTDADDASETDVVVDMSSDSDVLLDGPESAKPQAAPTEKELAGHGIRSVSSSASTSTPICLICLERLDPSDSASVVKMGCECKGAAAYRHRACLTDWLRHKGDKVCDVCRTDMANVSMPPPPPVPGWVVFPDLEQTWDEQWEAFRLYCWQNSWTVAFYIFVVALMLDVPLIVALILIVTVIAAMLLWAAFAVGVNSLAARTIIALHSPYV